jgi:hypothetical protein
MAEPGADFITEACAACIRSVPLEDICTWESEREVAAHLRSHDESLSPEELERRREAICRELRRTPRVPPFCQDDDWPLCCGDFTEYVGRSGLPEGWDDLGGLSLFRCPRCSKEFEVFQHT